MLDYNLTELYVLLDLFLLRWSVSGFYVLISLVYSASFFFQLVRIGFGFQVCKDVYVCKSERVSGYESVRSTHSHRAKYTHMHHAGLRNKPYKLGLCCNASAEPHRPPSTA